MLERGQLKNVVKLAFNPNNGQRDFFVYKVINNITKVNYINGLAA